MFSPGFDPTLTYRLALTILDARRSESRRNERRRPDRRTRSRS